MSAPYPSSTVICSGCSNPLPLGKPEPAWHANCPQARHGSSGADGG